MTAITIVVIALWLLVIFCILLGGVNNPRPAWPWAPCQFCKRFWHVDRDTGLVLYMEPLTWTPEDQQRGVPCAECAKLIAAEIQAMTNQEEK